MNKARAELELLLVDLRESIRRIRRFAAENDLEPPQELEYLERKQEALASQARQEMNVPA